MKPTPENQLIVIIENGHYASDYEIMDAVKRYKRLTGKYPTSNATIYKLQQEGVLADDITYNISDYGHFRWGNDVEATRLQ